MSIEKHIGKLSPMSETMLYILFALREKRHGYGVMLYVKEITNTRVVLGAGTIYQSISKLEKEKLIKFINEKDRKRFYQITELGKSTLFYEVDRIKQIFENMEGILSE